MGQLVTFQCPSCFRYWVLSEGSLEPITVHRAFPPGDAPKAGEETVWLPFWIADLNGSVLRRKIEDAAAGLQEASRAVIGIEPACAKRPPAQSEIRHIASRLESLGTLRIFIPAFKSLNTYAYLKVGRLLTRAQPPFTLERSDGAGAPVLCALPAREAAALMDFIFFATLGESLQSNGDFLERIHLEPSGALRLVEFPFRSRGASLVSVIGGFWISGRLVEGVSVPA